MATPTAIKPHTKTHSFMAFAPYVFPHHFLATPELKSAPIIILTRSPKEAVHTRARSLLLQAPRECSGTPFVTVISPHCAMFSSISLLNSSHFPTPMGLAIATRPLMYFHGVRVARLTLPPGCHPPLVPGLYKRVPHSARLHRILLRAMKPGSSAVSGLTFSAMCTM